MYLKNSYRILFNQNCTSETQIRVKNNIEIHLKFFLRAFEIDKKKIRIQRRFHKKKKKQVNMRPRRILMFCEFFIQTHFNPVKLMKNRDRHVCYVLMKNRYRKCPSFS